MANQITNPSNPALFIEGPLGSGKTRRLLDLATELLTDTPSSQVLILAANHIRQQQLIQQLYQKLEKPIGQLSVYTYLGYVRNTLFDWWPLVEAKIGNQDLSQIRLRPELSGLGDSELLLTLALQAFRHEHDVAFDLFPGTNRTLVKQLVRRLRLRSENRLNRKQMQHRSQTIDEICWADSMEMERRFDKASYTLRTLDSNKQIDVFHHLLEEAEDPQCLSFQQQLRQRTQYLLVDDVDESIPAQQALIRFFAPSVNRLILAADPDGGTRRGYLNAFPYNWPKLKTELPGETLNLIPDESSAIAKNAALLLDNWLSSDIKPLQYGPVKRFDLYATRVEMLDGVIEEITRVIGDGVSHIFDFCIVLPQADIIGLYHLKQQFSQRGIPIQLLSGTERPSDNPLVRAFLCLLQLANRQRWWAPLSMWELKTILVQILQLPLFSRDMLDDVVRACIEHQAETLTNPESPPLPPLEQLPIALSESYSKRYQALCDWLENAKEQSFESQLYSAFDSLIAPIASDETPLSDLKRVIESYTRQKNIYEGYAKYFPSGNVQAQLDLPQAGVFAEVDFDKLWLMQAKSGVVADTPEMPNEENPEALIIGTPQSILNMQVRRPIHCWLDIGSREWCRSDHAPLYHAWIHSPLCSDDVEEMQKWLENEATEKMLYEKAGHLTRTLMLLAKESVWLFTSDLDDEGKLQEGPLLERTILDSAVELSENANTHKITLRDDQAPVLDYTGKTLAISAVPGAGKTFTNVALILHLIETLNIPPEQILVLTYMDSAAQTLLGRVKKQLALRGIRSQQPAISTIHSLAMRILTDNDHARRVGLMPNEFSILDEMGQEEIMQQVQQRLQCKHFGKNIQNAKMQGVTPEDIHRYLAHKPQHVRLSEFYPAYALYMQAMHERGLLDFDDLILKAIYLLETYDDIRAYYQNKYKVIIEDEAQDSSQTLQRLIELIGGERANIIRTGDTNQSITTTFSSADPTVFREFITSAHLKVEMTQSARCAPEVIELSNDWMRYCLQYPSLRDAFQLMEMRPVTGHNPSLLFAPYAHYFESSKEETEWLVDSIARLKVKYPDQTIAVLVRRNDQVYHVCEQLQQAGIEAVSLTNQLNNSPVFALILQWLKLLACPLSLDQMDRAVTLHHQTNLYQAYLDTKLLEHTPEMREFMETRMLLFHEPDNVHNPYYAEMSEAGLTQLYFDGLEFSADVLRGKIAELVVKITNRLFHSVEARSNGYLCALLAESALNRHKDLETLSPIEAVIQHFEQCQRSRSSKKSFADLLQTDLSRVVQVMTLHKAKGQEFDIVLMPYLQKQSFRHEPHHVDFSEADKLNQALSEVKHLKETVQPEKDDTQHAVKTYEVKIRQSIIEEESRLAYVGFTRAKKGLILTAHALNDVLGFGRRKAEKTQPALMFDWANDWIRKKYLPPDVELQATTGASQHADA